jgi:uncharacterized protein (TIGR00369 family)
MPRSMDAALGDGGMRLLADLGVAFDAYGPGWAEAAWVPTDLAANPTGVVQGGVYAVVHDAAMNFATNSALERGEHGSTLDLQYQNIRAARVGDPLRVRGAVTRCTRQVAHVEAEIRTADGDLVTRATATFLVRRREAGQA